MEKDDVNKPRIYADFNKMSGDEKSRWLILTCRGTFDDLERLNIKFTEGLECVFYADDGDDKGNYDELEADGYAHFDSGKNYWVAMIDWDSIRHASDRR